MPPRPLLPLPSLLPDAPPSLKTQLRHMPLVRLEAAPLLLPADRVALATG